MIGLRSRIQPYAWGSHTAIAALQGRPVPAAGPEAELWLGAHPAAPSDALLPTGAVPLTELIAAEPSVLGPAVVARFGPRLPFLLKVLAAAQPLSLQAHPDADQAADGFARGLPCYVDPYHKPELLVALEDFEALCGFRAPAETVTLLASLHIPALKPVIALLDGPGLRPAVELLLGLPPVVRAALVESVAAAHPLAAGLAARYPDDVGVVLALLLNHVRLRPGEAVFMPAGNLHGYLRGVGIEVMAASDNVLRGGLTPKQVDAPELMRVLRYEALADPVVSPEPLAEGLVGWHPPVAEFALHRATPAGAGTLTLPGTGPRIVLAVAGLARLRAGEDTRTLASGEAVFVPATDPPVEVTGPTTVFQAAPAAPQP